MQPLCLQNLLHFYIFFFSRGSFWSAEEALAPQPLVSRVFVVRNKPGRVVPGSGAWWTCATAVTSSALAFFDGGSSAAAASRWGDRPEDFVFLDGFGDAGSGSAELADCPPPTSGDGKSLTRRCWRADRGLRGEFCFACDASRAGTSGREVVWVWGESAGGIMSGVGTTACASSASVLSAGTGGPSAAGYKTGDSGWGDSAQSASSVFSGSFSAACLSSTTSDWMFSEGGLLFWEKTDFLFY